MDPEVQKYLTTALAGALAGGGGAGLLSSQGGRRYGETPQERRNRILRNVLVGAAAGGVGGASLHGATNLLSTAAPERNAVEKLLQWTGTDNPILSGAWGAGGGAVAGGVGTPLLSMLRKARDVRDATNMTGAAGAGFQSQMVGLFKNNPFWKDLQAKGDEATLAKRLTEISNATPEYARINEALGAVQRRDKYVGTLKALVKPGLIGGAAAGGAIGAGLPLLAGVDSGF